jgi:hypothetical protein
MVYPQQSIWSIGNIRRVTWTNGEKDRDMPEIEIDMVNGNTLHTAKIIVSGDTLDDLFIAQDIVAALNKREKEQL